MTDIPLASTYSPPADLDRLRQNATFLGVVGSVVSIVGAVMDFEQFSRSYLVAWLYWLGIAMGCFGILMLHHLTRGAWGLMIRRVLEAASRTLLLLAILFVPIALRLADVFVWAQPGSAEDPLIAHKSWFLNEPFFVLRAVAYFTIWGVLVVALTRLSPTWDWKAAVHSSSGRFPADASPLASARCSIRSSPTSRASA